MQSKIEDKKKQKKSNLERAAYELFAEKGISGISVDEIVKRAKVAKGTFYLYFHDKTELLNKVIILYSTEIIHSAMVRAQQQNIESCVERIIFLVDDIIERFKRDPEVLKIINKNLSEGLLNPSLLSAQAKENQTMEELLAAYTANMKKEKFSAQESFQLLYMIIELVAQVSYHAILRRQPTDIDHLKPILYESIRKILRR